MTEQELRNALKRSLSDELPVESRRAVLMKISEERKRPVVKSKFSVGLILVIVLTLLSTVALAVTLSREYFEDVAELQFESGWYEDWSLKEKLAMVDILQEYDIIDADKAAQLDTEEEIDAYMVARYGVEGSDRIDTIGLYSILDKELGEMRTWSLEQRAWYTDMMIRVGLLKKGSSEGLCDLPNENDIQPEEAIAIAKAAIIEAYGLAEDALDGHKIDISFETDSNDWEREKLHYMLSFWGDGLEYYWCIVTRDGQIMDSTMDEYSFSPAEQVERKRQREEIEQQVKSLQPVGPEAQWSLEEKAYWFSEDNGLPTKFDITEEEALRIARQRLADIGYDMTDYKPSVWYKLYDRYATDDKPHAPFYVIYFYDSFEEPTEVFSVTIDAATGEVLTTYTPKTMPSNG